MSSKAAYSSETPRRKSEKTRAERTDPSTMKPKTEISRRSTSKTDTRAFTAYKLTRGKGKSPIEACKLLNAVHCKYPAYKLHPPSRYRDFN
ncbi:hypothetical protein Bca52824_054355 [Brassica carinata]|uniref:Uncharacterized protein n=2 Tax=Brassica TaxID=3705 RepID=A0A8S9PWQ9_BRACR|nr:hypothetical protein F2Q69_00024011 [Brassica cretica]KAG2283135.1 hypothetical protein Bca52824_054355 [Brassica carinata]